MCYIIIINDNAHRSVSTKFRLSKYRYTKAVDPELLMFSKYFYFSLFPCQIDGNCVVIGTICVPIAT